MEEIEDGKDWLVAHGGDQSGPFSRFDLMVEAARGKLHPRRDMVWKSGMDEWIPAGGVEWLFKRKEDAMAAEQAKSAFTECKPELSAKEKKIIKGEWTGAGRGTYLFLCYMLSFLWVAGVGYGNKIGKGIVESQILIIAASFGFTAYTLTQAAEDDAMRIAIDDYIRIIEEAQKVQEKR
jgi:hypothetical protein